MANGFEFLAQSMAPDIRGSFEQGRAQARQRERERLADQELRAGIDRGNRLRQLAPRGYTAATPGERQQYLTEVAAINPQAAAQYETQFVDRDQRARTSLGNAATLLTRLPPEARAGLYQREILPGLRSLGIELPDQYTPEVDATAMKIAAALRSGGAPRPISVSPGETLIDPQTGQPIYSSPAAPAKPMDALGQLEADRRAGLISNDDFAARRRLLTTRDAPQINLPSGYRWNTDGTMVPIPGGPADPNTKPPKDPSEGDKKARVLLQGMRDAEAQLAGAGGADTSSIGNAMLSRLPGGGAMQSDEFKQYKAAADRWASNYLYLKSGAQAGKDEIATTVSQFFPQPGDGPDVVAQKAAARAQEMESVGGTYEARPQPSAPPPPRGQPTPPAPQSQGIDELGYASLPSGTQYRAPDGTIRTKR